MKTNNINKPLTKNEKIKAVLFSIGINEKYISFDYLADFLETIAQKEFTPQLYNETINLISAKHKITIRTAKQGIAKVIKMCKLPEITTSLKFNLSSKSLFNKINVLKCYAEKNINLNSTLDPDENAQEI